MVKSIFKVISCGDIFTLQKAADGGHFKKRTLVLQELGGEYEDKFVCACLGNTAEGVFYKDELVYAALRFSTRDVEDRTYQDCTVSDIVKLSN